MNWQILKKRKQPSILLIEQSLLHIITIHIKLYKCNNFIYIKALHTHWTLSKKYWFLLHVNNISELYKLYILFFLQDTRDEGWRSHWLKKNTIFSWTILLIKVIKTSKSRDSNNKMRKCKIGVAHTCIHGLVKSVQLVGSTLWAPTRMFFFKVDDACLVEGHAFLAAILGGCCEVVNHNQNRCCL